MSLCPPQWSDDPDVGPSRCSTAVSIVQQHYHPDREVVLRSEFLPERQFRVIDSCPDKWLLHETTTP